MEDEMKEFRQAKRIQMNRHIEFEQSAHLSAEGGISKAFGLDISSGGLGFSTEEELQAGSVLKVYIPFDEGEAKVPVFAEVVWSKVAEGQCRAGLRFLA